VTRLALVLVVLAVAAGVWTQRQVVLRTVGGLVVEETPLARADVLVVFRNVPRVAAEAAAILKAGYAPRIVVLRAPPRPDDEVLRRLGLDPGLEHDVAIRVLRASGVPGQLIDLLPVSPDGTNEAAHEIARYARQHRVTRVIAVTERSHTRRTARLLRRELGGKGMVIVRAAERDPFEPDTWWQNRWAAREFATEALRWGNSFVLRDWWKSWRSQDDPPPAVAPGRRYDAAAPRLVWSARVTGPAVRCV
jgi:hypothetical protein